MSRIAMIFMGAFLRVRGCDSASPPGTATDRCGCRACRWAPTPPANAAWASAAASLGRCESSFGGRRPAIAGRQDLPLMPVGLVPVDVAPLWMDLHVDLAVHV